MKEIKEEEAAMQAQMNGINKAVDLAKLTLGGKGRLINIDIPGGIHSTADGVTVLRHVAMRDKTEDMGVKAVLEVAEKQVRECEDGTTSVSILFQELIKRGFKSIQAGADSLKLREGINMAAKEAIEHVEKMSKKIKRDSDEVKQVAYVSSHGDEGIASLVSDVISMTNKNSIIRVEDSSSIDSYIELTEGIKVGSGWLSHLFINNGENNTVEYDKPLVLIYDGKIDSLRSIVHLLDYCNKGEKPLLIVSENMDGEVLTSLAINAQRGAKFAAINVFGYNREDAKMRLKDLSIAIGAEMVSPDLGHKLEDVDISDLGTCEKLIISQEDTVFQKGAGTKEEINTRVKELESLVKEAKDGYNKELLKGRLAALSGGIGTIFVGGVIGSDAKERKDRFDDAVGAALCSLEDGVVPGGGVSLLRVAQKLSKLRHADEDVQTGINIFVKSIEIPIKQILRNAGLSEDYIIEKIKSNKSMSYGYNVYTDEYIDMVEAGILDPAKVEINVIRNASTAASKFLNVAGTIAVVPE